MVDKKSPKRVILLGNPTSNSSYKKIGYLWIGKLYPETVVGFIYIFLTFCAFVYISVNFSWNFIASSFFTFAFGVVVAVIFLPPAFFFIRLFRRFFPEVLGPKPDGLYLMGIFNPELYKKSKKVRGLLIST